ncbi:MAG: hypothetical protein A2887_00740 [Alphaproteobacteria bacterium RIFCSPLOWO2_01_FULL_40_26]|nr:MAG: hypothetical protein A3D15_02530 [Alphaproteobacteria bacterium RIFCSPHIGHO2_02_FULL_40_34]OFW95236.1 MAG: hypothetical protein A2887_00740 [Alphaproteobacteria bacterium RIFCSPLOWO2_01_FULL_40_26]OFX09363.1 MAG: hypothetical protein A3H30_06860 [Alphaproteobacteria bacterium RIFCSPLOWO2_02_FULL_40_19]OFX12206.1 MAG: hypothetical protein A3G22_03440 [Alphaproteobacteria bacterium RIFCSPLOWO2_12_FULL_40_11]
MVEFDVVIPAHSKDLTTLEYCIAAAKKKISGVRRVIIVSKERYSDNAEWFDESLFPFSFDFVASCVGDSSGWYFQQLLKFYAPFVIPDITKNVLILDSDTIFFRKVKMFDDEDRALYNISKDKDIKRKNFDQKVSSHIRTLLPAIAVENLPKEFQAVSGVSHHMIFNREILHDLFRKIEEHDGSGEPFYKIFLKRADHGHSVSEYQIYFNFILIFHRDKIRIRKLRYKNTSDPHIWKYRFRFKYHYCSFHSYLRGTKQGLFKKNLQKIWNKLFYVEIWNIGIVRKNIAEFLSSPAPKIEWLPHPKFMTFRADPFALDERNIVFEHYDYWMRKGKIHCLTFDDNFKIIAEKEILHHEKHLSYPFIIKHEGRIFMVCESYKSNNLSLYEIDQKTLRAKKLREIFANKAAIDPTIFYHNEKFWLFYSSRENPDVELNIAFADSLFSEFKDHPKNPVRINKSGSRCAGTIFTHKGKIYRPAQDCGRTYGGAVIINEITLLDCENFAEKFVTEIRPQSPYNNGLHTISQFGDFTLLDGKRRIFVIHKPLISLLRNLKKYLSIRDV